MKKIPLILLFVFIISGLYGADLKKEIKELKQENRILRYVLGIQYDYITVANDASLALTQYLADQKNQDLFKKNQDAQMRLLEFQKFYKTEVMNKKEIDLDKLISNYEAFRIRMGL
jgi:hypothetical protein